MFLWNILQFLRCTATELFFLGFATSTVQFQYILALMLNSQLLHFSSISLKVFPIVISSCYMLWYQCGEQSYISVTDEHQPWSKGSWAAWSCLSLMQSLWKYARLAWEIAKGRSIVVTGWPCFNSSSAVLNPEESWIVKATVPGVKSFAWLFAKWVLKLTLLNLMSLML